jgi:hypothetical protein
MKVGTPGYTVIFEHFPCRTLGTSTLISGTVGSLDPKDPTLIDSAYMIEGSACWIWTPEKGNRVRYAGGWPE